MQNKDAIKMATGSAPLRIQIQVRIGKRIVGLVLRAVAASSPFMRKITKMKAPMTELNDSGG